MQGRNDPQQGPSTEITAVKVLTFFKLGFHILGLFSCNLIYWYWKETAWHNLLTAMPGVEGCDAAFQFAGTLH
jgi:hypothetical protein